MDLDQFMSYCEEKPGVEPTFPFGEETLVYKVMGKMFTASNINSVPFRVNLKCDPEKALQLREEYAEIIPGFHMNKKHWNTVLMDEGGLPQSLITELIDHSYELVVSSLTKKMKIELESLANER